MSRRNDGSAAPRNAAKKKGTKHRKRGIKAKAPKFQRDSRLKSDDYLYQAHPASMRNNAFDELFGVIWKALDNCNGERFLEPILVADNGMIRYTDARTGVLMESFGTMSKGGYLLKGIRTDKHPMGKVFGVHRLVWTAFNGEIPVGMDIDHINGNKEDNRLINLRVVTRSENCLAFGSDRRTHNKSLPVKAVNLKTGKTIFFKSANDAGRNKFNLWNVVDACKGIYNRHRRKDGGTDVFKGYRWSYVDETDKTELALYSAFIDGQLSVFDNDFEYHGPDPKVDEIIGGIS